MEQNKSKDNVLYVKMFGSFSMIYAGESVLGNKVSETQFTYMMQILLHNRKNGVSRESLEEMLFGDRDIKNIHHTMQSVIYKMCIRDRGRTVCSPSASKRCSGGFHDDPGRDDCHDPGDQP